MTEPGRGLLMELDQDQCWRAHLEYGPRGTEGPETWVGGARRLQVVIAPESVTGRRLLPG